MVSTTISVRIDEQLHRQMKLYEEINWSALVRKAVAEQVEQIEHIDVERAKKAAEKMDNLRKMGAFRKGKESTAIIREWRNKRRL